MQSKSKNTVVNKKTNKKIKWIVRTLKKEKCSFFVDERNVKLELLRLKNRTMAPSSDEI